MSPQYEYRSFTFISQQKQGLYSKAITASDWLDPQSIYRKNYHNSLWLVQSCISMWKQCCGRKQQCGRKEVTVRQETATWRSPCSSVLSLSLYLPNRVPCLPLPRLTSRSEPGLLNGTKLCPLSSSQDSTSVQHETVLICTWEASYLSSSQRRV